MPTPLALGDQVRACVAGMQYLLELLPVRYLLTNGKIEKQLKCFFGASWERGNAAIRASATDKRPFANLELDVLCFENAAARFWAELKCSFGKDRNDVTRSATTAVAQAISRLNNICVDSLDCDSYIVHFLTSLPPANDPLLPEYILALYQTLRGQEAFPPNQLELLYEVLLQNYYHASATIPAWGDPNVNPAVPTAFAVIVKLRRATSMHA